MFKTIIAITIATVIFFGIIVGAMIGMPHYNVWRLEMRGQAAFREAEWAKQIIEIEAQAVLAAERLNAQAEVVRAEGMARAMEIEGGKLTELYIFYLWVRTMAEHGNVIYVPTEAGLPILEAGRIGAR